MWKYALILLVLSSFSSTNCDVELKIFRVIDENYSQVTLGVEEKAGTNLTLTCDLVGTKFSDDQIIWGKASNELYFRNKTDLEQLVKRNASRFMSMLRQSEINRAMKKFTPLRPEDGGTYFCASLKYKRFEVVYIVVKDVTVARAPPDSFRNGFYDGNIYCSEKMFKCKTNSGCISPHYVCDKKIDCQDGSDESYEICNGDPCKDKLQCDDGRCIPMYWCCDRYVDTACNVTYRHQCCHILNEQFEEPEFGYTYNKTGVRASTPSFMFFFLCVLASVFSMVLMLLILSKVFQLARKRALLAREADIFQLEERGRQYRGYVPCNFRSRTTVPCDDAPSSPEHLATDALLILSDDIIRFGDVSDRPPSYSDVVSQAEPPPPYTSQDCLNRT